MKIVVASDSYKGCMTSSEVADIMQQAILDVDETIEVKKITVADGGEGFIQAMVDATGGRIRTCRCVDSYLNPTDSIYGVIYGDTAVIEVAKIIGLVKRKNVVLQPEKGSSFGVGMMIKEVIRQGYKKIIIGLGGSCTNDGGMGVLNALGMVFYDTYGNKLYPKAENLEYIVKIDASNFIDVSNLEVTVACDVKNHLLGQNGATYVFGPQKGVTDIWLTRLEKGMENYCALMRNTFNIDLDAYEGGGAAGGIGSVLLGLLHAKMQLGIELLLDAVHFDEEIKDADVIFTGEGQTDAQSLQGKAVFGILKHAKEQNVPLLCLSGALKEGYQKLYDYGASGCYSILNSPMPYPQAFQLSRRNLYNTTYSLVKTMVSVRGEK
ncbi:MAG: glycerate kinase [Erysipelotrichaceae bacterium]|nr:glycerate kinase [Erysipelotrichaceae bacterium]